MGTGKLAGKWDDILGGGGGRGVTLQCNSSCLFILRNRNKLGLDGPVGSRTGSALPY